jgi:hypothetical protein
MARTKPKRYEGYSLLPEGLTIREVLQELKKLRENPDCEVYEWDSRIIEAINNLEKE